VILPSKER